MRSLLDLVFPPRCAACRAFLEGHERHLCAACAASLVELSDPRCPRCALPEAPGLCPRCRDKAPAFTRVDAVFLHGGAIADVISRLKYRDTPRLGAVLAELCLPMAREAFAWSSLIAPIPLHPHRLRWRGFNQSQLLAEAIARLLGRRISVRALSRTRHTPPQVGRSGASRLKNVAGAFAARGDLVANSRLLLVDDVMTTGATAHEASLAALNAGAREVRVFCVARAM